MDIRNVDLNLLVALDALLAERSVSRAAVRLHLSQPATSAVIKWAHPVFTHEGRPFALVRALGDHVLFGFWGGVDLEDLSEATIPPDFRDRRIHRCYRLVKR